MLDIQLDYLKAVNYVLIHNGVALCMGLELHNRGNQAEDLQDVQVTCTGEFVQPYESAVLASIPAGRSVRVPKFEIVPDAMKLGAQTEHVSTSFTLTVWKNAADEQKEQLFQKEYPLELMAYDQWMGTGTQPQGIVSFVTPNHPSVAQITVKAAKHLKRLTGSSAFTGYQSGNPNEVRRQIAAIFGALHEENIVYRSLPASFEKAGQRITLPEQVLSGKLGNCIELTVLLASVLESVGINSGIVLQKGHAFLGIWLVNDSCRYSICDDLSFIEKKCSEGIGEMMVLECTELTSESTSFEKAQASAQQSLLKQDEFEMFIDVKRCRLEGYRPLPSRIMNNGEWQLDLQGVEHDSCNISTTEHSRYDLSKVAQGKAQLTRMDIWERKLLDFSLRNSMLNLSLRQKAIQLISFEVNRLEDQLQRGEEFCVMERPEVDLKLSTTERLFRSKSMEQLHNLILDDIMHNKLHTYQSQGETRTVLKNIYRSARNSIEETGANSLFLAVGTLRWYETEQSDTARYAPILMLPVEMVYKRGNYYFRLREEEATLNITLMEFLRQNYGISIDGLNPLPKDDQGVDVSLVFAVIRDALKDQKRWDVEEECVLGVFSFSKFLMWNDIHNHRQELLDNKIVKSLVEQRLTWQPEPLETTLKDRDKQMKPHELALPVAVDSSQMSAVVEAGLGHSFILYGPPGTGKSQTITNLIANALFQGKRVLFVAEKMAALSVVQNRLAKIGLEPFCLEMHSNKIAKRHVLDQLKKAIDVSHILSPEEYQQKADKLYEQRAKLIQYMESLHEKDSRDGFSLYDCILRYESIPSHTLAGFESNAALESQLTSTAVSDYEQLLSGQLQAVVKLVGSPSAHALLGWNIGQEELRNEQGTKEQLAQAIARIQSCIDNYTKLSGALSQRESLLKDNKPELLTQNARQLYDEWRSIQIKWFLPKFFAQRSFMKKMRQYNAYLLPEQTMALLESLMDYQEKHHTLATLQQDVQHWFGTALNDDEQPSVQTLNEMITKLTTWKENTQLSRDWYQWCEFRNQLKQKGLDCVITALETNEEQPDMVCDTFLKAFFRHKAQQKLAATSHLCTFEGMLFDEQVEQYKRLTEEFQLLSQKELYARLARQIPRVTNNIDSSSEIGLLNRNISNGGRGTSLRDLFDQIPTLMPKLCPCMLMSPMSVAQYLNLNQDKFDLVIFDEASQMPTSEAVGAIARGNALIVVGDPKQMPPTSFFTSSNVDEEEADIDDLESILEDCRTLQIPSLQLNWHYRSRHESLIAFSNNEYYDRSLITFPSVDDQNTKVKFVPVKGVYDKGGRRSNQAEAEAIVKEVEKRLSDPKHDKSIGIIAFSVVQQNLIEDILQDKLDKNKALREAADALYEPIFVKNLENVQGDERDIILFSIGYGPDKSGNVSMNFGPLNNAGGERRLNVAVSRARHEMMVFSTLRAAQIDLRRSKAKGVEGLKHFLEYAEHQMLPGTERNAEPKQDEILAQKLADCIAQYGYVTRVGIGKSKFKVDVAISRKRSPKVYLLGILLDGEGYRDTQTTRDREIVQPSVLRSLNWQVMRVWSVDWINNPDRVISRILERLKSQPTPPEKEVFMKFDISKEKKEKLPTYDLEYKEFTTTPEKAVGMTDYALARDIIHKEQPITYAMLCRRITALRCAARVSRTLQKSLQDIIQQKFYAQPDRQGMVIWQDEESSKDYLWYRTNSHRDILDTPMVEIKNVVMEAVREQFAISIQALNLIAAKKLGFTRRGSNLDNALNEAISQLVQEGQVNEADGKVSLTYS